MKPYLLGFTVFLAPLAQGTVPGDPWTLVPAFPTACYGKQDDFDEVVLKNIDMLTAEIGRQDKINEETKQVKVAKDSSGQVDPWAMSRQMTESAMKNPEAAAQTTQAANASIEPSRQADQQQEEKDRTQKEALAKLIARYEAEFKGATKTDLVYVGGGWSEGRDAPAGDGVSTGGGSTYLSLVRGTPTTQEQAIAYSRHVDQVYETQVCPKWWKAGPFQTWLTGYRAFLAADVPRQEQVEATQNDPLKLQGVNLDAYHSTAKMKAVKKYLQSVREVYGGNPGFSARWEHAGQPPAQ